MATTVTTTPLDVNASVVAYNTSHTSMAVADHAGRLTIWIRDGPNRDWIPAHSFNSETPQITCLAWSPPEFGSVLCAGAGDGSVAVWRLSQGRWELTCKLSESTQGVLSLCFAPHKMGPIMTAAYADGTVRLFEASSLLEADTWSLHSEFSPGPKACTALSWKKETTDLPPLLIVGTAQATATIWTYRIDLMRWERALQLGDSYSDYSNHPITDVAWAPTLGRPHDLIAVAAGDRVVLWSVTGSVDRLQADRVATLEHDHTVWQLGWNVLGNFLAASTEGGEVVMWRSDLAGEWSKVTRIKGVKEGDVMNTEEGMMVD